MEDDDDYFARDKFDDLPIVSPGVKVLIQLRDAGHGEPQPDGTVVWVRGKSEVVEMTILDIEVCGHSESMCRECMDSWAHDWYINLPETPAHLGF